MRFRRVPAVCILIPSILLGLAPAAHASCVAQPSLADSVAAAPVVFTGTVTALTGGDRIATVLVDEVWKGGPLPAEVEVHGGPANPEMVTSVDRTFKQGDKYLFVPSSDWNPFQDNICTATREYSPELEESRRLGGQPPGDPSAEPSDPASGPSQGTKALIFALSLALALLLGWMLKDKAAG